MSDPYLRPMNIARKSRLNSTHHKRMGCCIVKHGKVISVGFNIQKSHPKYADGKKSYSIHAEISAILKSKTDLNGSTIFVYREIKGIPALAKPCNNCLKEIIEVGIKKIVYSVSHYPYFEEIIL